MSAQLHALLLKAQAARDGSRWAEAVGLFGTAASIDPASFQIRHNLALCHFASGRFEEALRFARDAVRLRPDLWQSMMIESKVHRARGRTIEAEAALDQVLRFSPGNPTALSALADIEINEYGDPAAAIRRVRPLLDHPETATDAELTTLMADLYLQGDSAENLSDRLRSFSRRNLRLPMQTPKPRPARSRPRIALVSPLFSASPVYFMTFNVFEALAEYGDLICFNRSNRQDWATRAFADIASEWHEVAHHEPAALAQAICEAEVDILFDLGGWTDAAALTALSSKPAPRMFTWVGGQSATTGLDMFDGWIGDIWQSPADLAHLYAEPLINIPGGYCDYRAPDALRSISIPKRRNAVGLVGNPCKIGNVLAAAWPAEITQVTLIDRRYAHARTCDRVTALLREAGVRQIDIIVPQGHAEYLQALAGMKAIVNTVPYSGGLTTIEAMALGVEIVTLPGDGRLFCERHHLSHRHTSGRNPGLVAAIAKLVLK
ncbi:MAG: hypothetical protein JWR77_136 [Rhizorhabdus sp.]|nr:hypothetical protein [Rhizorhabdus sp.]